MTDTAIAALRRHLRVHHDVDKVIGVHTRVLACQRDSVRHDGPVSPWSLGDTTHNDVRDHAPNVSVIAGLTPFALAENGPAAACPLLLTTDWTAKVGSVAAVDIPDGLHRVDDGNHRCRVRSGC